MIIFQTHQVSKNESLFRADMRRKLKITGPYKGITGYDNHTRYIVKALYKAGLEVGLTDLPEWSPAKLPLLLQDQWFEQLQRSIDADTHLFFSMPHQVQSKKGERIINYTMFEANRIPALWVRHSEEHDLIIVPANFCKQAWIDSGVPEEKLIVCPLGVDSKLFNPDVEPHLLYAPDGRSVSNFKTRFLNISEASDRKNIIGLLRAWLTVTSAKDDALLILKPGFYTQSTKENFRENLMRLEKFIGKSFNQAAPILYIGQIFSSIDMPRLYTSATHYISTSYGEGFDLPMLEAGVSGLQLIAPRHSAYLDYLHDNIAHLISTKPVEAKLPGDPATGEFFAGAHWWEPDYDELCEIIRLIIDGKAEKLSAKNELSELTWTRTAEHLEKIIFSN